MATVKMNIPYKRDNDGYIHGLVTVTESITIKTVNSGGKNKRDLTIDDSLDKEFETIDFTFSCQTIRKDVTKDLTSKIFNISFNPEYELKRIGTKNVKIYNKFTTALLKLGIVSESDLDHARKDMSDINPDDLLAELLAIKDKPVKFKLGKNKNGYDEVDFLSLNVLSDSVNTE